VAASSPELFLSLGPRGELLTLPIKGTRPRGADARADAAMAEGLENDPKERAELSMVVDVERNDLGRVARIGSVRVPGAPRVEAFGAVLHRTASVRAALRPGVTRTELLEAMLPSGSVTGAPKIRAMELIAALEAARRGLYTGAFGFLSHDGGLRLGMAIRTVTARDEIAHYFAGGGIVFGSEPAREVLETRWKAAQILRLIESGKVASEGGP
jgi:anthranilate/para-aminobenzoate synthase component I